MSEDKSGIISFHFEKTKSFQTLHADGVFQSLTPNGHGFLAFFVERSPIPHRVDFSLDSGGSLGDVLDVEAKQGIFREVHTGLTLTKEGLVDLLERIEVLLKGMEEKNA